MNHSVEEIAMFDIKQGQADPNKNFPEPFWIPQLEKFMHGGGCAAKVPNITKCPNEFWRQGGESPGCCESNSRRGTGSPKCNVSCAEAECAAANMIWKPFNYSKHPYECCATSR
jgi:hypothetical protein